MRFQHLFAAAAAGLALCACTPVYVRAPAMDTYFAELIPTAKADQVEKVLICLAHGRDGAPDWFATVTFTDESVYHYQLHLPTGTIPIEKPVELSYFNTKEMREAGQSRRRRGCTGQDDYWFKVPDGVVGYVLRDTSIQTPFDDTVKLRLKRAAQAVEAASEAHKKFVPNTATWGIKS